MAACKGQKKTKIKMVAIILIWFWWLMFWNVKELATLWTLLTIAFLIIGKPLMKIIERYL